MSLGQRICSPFLLSVLLTYIGSAAAKEQDNSGPYATLSDAAKQKFRNEYESLPPEDEPPYPLQGRDAINRQVGKLNQRIFGVGNLVAAVLVDENGAAQSVNFYSLPVSDVDVSEAELRRVYAAVLMGVAYKPAVCGGKPCVMEFLYRAEFSKQRSFSH